MKRILTNKKFITMIFMIIAALFILFGTSGCYNYMNEQTVECTVEEKWIKRTNSEGSDLYLVSCGGKVYKVADLLFKGKFNSADIYAKLKVGNKYRLTTTGYRWGFLSEYQNINEYELIG